MQISPGMASLREGMCQHSGRGAGFPEVGHSVDSILLVNNSNWKQRLESKKNILPRKNNTWSFVWIQAGAKLYCNYRESPYPSGFYTHRFHSCSSASGISWELCFTWPHPRSGPWQREMDSHIDCALNSFQSHFCPGLKRPSFVHMAKPNSKGDEKNYHLTRTRNIWRITLMTGAFQVAHW